MYVNLPIGGILQTTSFWLNMNSNNSKQVKQQTLSIILTLIKQNYFQYNGKIYQPHKGIAMGSPISSTIAEIYIQYFESLHVKHWLESSEIIFYKRYVDDIFIVYDTGKTNAQNIFKKIYKIDPNLQFKITYETDNTITYMDLSISRSNNKLELGIYRKPIETGTVIHSNSNHPYEQKMSAFIYYINRLLQLPITEESKQSEWETILAIARNNGYSTKTINNLKKKLLTRKQNPQDQNQEPTETRKKWVTFTYHSPLIRRVTNLFKQTDLNIAFRATNTIRQQISDKQTINNPCGVYRLKCNTCNKVYVGQSGRTITQRYKEHIRYIKANNPVSAYATHIVQNIHEFGPEKDTMQLVKKCQKAHIWTVGKHYTCTRIANNIY